MTRNKVVKLLTENKLPVDYYEKMIAKKLGLSVLEVKKALKELKEKTEITVTLKQEKR